MKRLVIDSGSPNVSPSWIMSILPIVAMLQVLRHSAKTFEIQYHHGV